MENYFYDNYLINLAKEFQSEIDKISAEYNFELGNEFEIAICQVLRQFLPLKYGICRGFVVNSAGDKQGDDIIIYDQERFPTLRLLTKNDFSRKENIPIEAVYAYIEAKHKIDESTFDKAVSQVQAVKKLCMERDKIGLYQTDPYVDNNRKPPYIINSLPQYRNPIVGIVLGAFSTGVNGTSKETDTNQIELFLAQKKLLLQNNEYLPDLIISGNSNYLRPGYLDENNNTIGSLYYIFTNKAAGYQNMKCEGLAFGVMLAHLFASIDWIRLGKMPWIDMINQV